MTTLHTLVRTPRAHGEDGAATVELALVFVVFFMLLWGILTYGVVFSVSHTLNAASAEAARAAVGTRTESDAIAAATASALDQLTVLGGSAGNAVVSTPTVGACAAPAGTRCLTIEVSYPYGAQPVIPLPGVMAVLVPATLSSSSTIQLSQ